MGCTGVSYWHGMSSGANEHEPEKHQRFNLALARNFAYKPSVQLAPHPFMRTGSKEQRYDPSV